MTEHPGSLYTVRQLIRELENWDGDSTVAAYSGCHNCGGQFLEIDGWVDGNEIKHVSITGHDETLIYSEEVD